MVKAPQGDCPPAGDGGLLAEPLLDAKATAELLGVKPSWVYEATRSGALPYIKVGRHTRFLRSDLEAWVMTQRHGCGYDR